VGLKAEGLPGLAVSLSSSFRSKFMLLLRLPLALLPL
jgi:hypothetical protein